MNRKDYNSDLRYAKVLEQMDLLGIMDISTTRQSKNGTIVWKLPIKDQDSGILIEVASFKTGYVRNQNSASSNYQLNKQVDGKPEYYKLSNGDYVPKWKHENELNYARKLEDKVCTNERTMREVQVIIDGHKWNLL